MLRVSRVRALLLIVLPALLLTGLAAPAGAGAKVLLTVAARQCPTYTDIAANRARNNIQESLKDLGPDTTYVAGQAIDPAIEAKTQPNCTPLPGWTFTLGTGYKSRAITGPWGALSIVTGAFSSPTMVTQASTPLLNTQGGDTGSTIAGATTVTLTDQQANLAAQANKLWIQGGTTTDPILNVQYPSQYGFGALRCAIDNLNGDNVEWISYPSGTTHVFCFAYYVKPPPTSGTIIVRKVMSAPTGTPSQAFRFTGNISFNTDDSFTLTAGPTTVGSQTFYRAQVDSSTPPWDFTEDVPPGWDLSSISCTSANGTSTSTTNVATAKTVVALAASDTVTCTYTNVPEPPPPGQLVLSKTTLGGVGTFDFDVKDRATGDTVHTEKITTATEGDPVGSPDIPLPAGSYSITESAPDTKGGSWALTRVVCDGTPVLGSTKPTFPPVNISIAAGDGAFCAFTNTFTPDGEIVIRKQTFGAVGTTGFVISPVDDVSRSYEKKATTTREGDPVTATGDPTDKLELGTYRIQETTPTETTDGTWSLLAVSCNGVVLPADQGQVTIKLTNAEPRVDCTFSNNFKKNVEPPIPPGPDPEADLVITKSPKPKTIRLGKTVTYTVKVRNRGPDDAENVVIVEQRAKQDSILSITPQLQCVRTPVPACLVGTVKAGETKTYKVVARPKTTGTFANRAVVVTSTAEVSTKNNVAVAKVKVLKKRGGGGVLPFTG